MRKIFRQEFFEMPIFEAHIFAAFSVSWLFCGEGHTVPSWWSGPQCGSRRRPFPCCTTGSPAASRTRRRSSLSDFLLETVWEGREMVQKVSIADSAGPDFSKMDHVTYQIRLREKNESSQLSFVTGKKGESNETALQARGSEAPRGRQPGENALVRQLQRLIEDHPEGGGVKGQNGKQAK